MYNELGVFHALYTSADHNHNIKSVFGNREYYDYDDFDENDCVCPTISQVLKWLRKEKGIYINLISFHTFANKNEVAFAWCIRLKIDGEWRNIEENSSYSTYEECAISAIKDVLDNLI